MEIEGEGEEIERKVGRKEGKTDRHSRLLLDASLREGPALVLPPGLAGRKETRQAGMNGGKDGGNTDVTRRDAGAYQ